MREIKGKKRSSLNTRVYGPKNNHTVRNGPKWFRPSFYRAREFYRLTGLNGRASIKDSTMNSSRTHSEESIFYGAQFHALILPLFSVKELSGMAGKSLRSLF